MSYFPGEAKLDAAINAATSRYGNAGEVYGSALKAGIGLTGGAIVAQAAPLLAAAVSSTLIEAGAAIGGTAAGVASGVLAGSATAAGASLATATGIASAVAPYAVPVIVVVAAAAGIAIGFEQAAENVASAYRRAVNGCIRPPPYGLRIAPVGTGPKGRDGQPTIRPVDVFLRQDGGGPYEVDPSPTSIGEAFRALETARLLRPIKPDFLKVSDQRFERADVLTDDDRATLRSLREAIESDVKKPSSKALLFPLYLSTLTALRRRGLTNAAWTQAWLVSRGMRPELAANLADPTQNQPSWRVWLEIAAPSRFPRSSGWGASPVRIDWPSSFGDSWCWWADLVVPPVAAPVLGLPFGVQGAATIVDDWARKTSALDNADAARIRSALRRSALRAPKTWASPSKRTTESTRRRRVVVAGGSALLLTGAALLLRSGAWRSILSRGAAI